MAGPIARQSRTAFLGMPSGDAAKKLKQYGGLDSALPLSDIACTMPVYDLSVESNQIARASLHCDGLLRDGAAEHSVTGDSK